MTRIPVTLVTGFLGAGKTTLLNHILDAKPERRFAVIENEFGDVGVDGSLFNDACDILYELNDGCICCSVREDLIGVFDQLLQRVNDIDHVVIETTGLAEPEPVMRIFDLPEINGDFELAGVITVVDAAHVEASLDDVTACLEQIAYADLLILNKVDQVDASALDAVEAKLKLLNPLASIVRAQHSRIDVDAFLHVDRRAGFESIQHGHDHDHDHDHGHQHDDSIKPVVVELNGDVDVAALDQWLGQLTRRTDSPLLRMKGILAVPGDPRRFVFNGVRSVVDVRPDRAWGDDGRFCRIVMIGRDLDSAALQQGFTACAVSSP